MRDQSSRRLLDPVHGLVELDAFEWIVLNSSTVQRLRRIRQLGFNCYVYPGAEHSRFSHSIGVMHVAGLMYDRLVWPRDEKARKVVRLAALLHDVGHAPFSHWAENRFEAGHSHELMTRILLEDGPMRLVFKKQGAMKLLDSIVSVLFSPRDLEERRLATIINGPVDADKIDYLLRDSHFSGVNHGRFDVVQLLSVVGFRSSSPNLEWLDPSPIEEPVVWSFLLARHLMFRQVYFHPRSKAFELHLQRWMQEANRSWPIDPARFLAADDYTVWNDLARSSNQHARALASREAFPLAYESEEQLGKVAAAKFLKVLAQLESSDVLVAHSSTDRYADLVQGLNLPPSHLGAVPPISQVRVYAKESTRSATREAVSKIAKSLGIKESHDRGDPILCRSL